MKIFQKDAREQRRSRDREEITSKRSSKKERREDALAPGAEEGRDKLRKASGRSKYPIIRGCPNGETRLRRPQSSYDESIVIEKGTWGTETSKYPQEEKERSIF